MKEDRLQSDIVRRYSELYPERRGRLFHVPNQRNHKLQAFQARGLGIFPGVSDLIYIGYGYIKCIELKTPGSRHKVDHIIQQVEWGKLVESLGHEWRICTNLVQAIKFIDDSIHCDALKFEDVEKMLKENGNKKTIKF